MFLTVGEISKAVGMSKETIRYYVNEGIITPVKNSVNHYWEYSSEDLMRLTDILFYRSMNFTIKDIKTIMNGLKLEDIGGLIANRKSELIKEIRNSMEAIYSLNDWEERYKKELNLIGKFQIDSMPEAFRRYGCFEEPNHMAKYLEDCFDIAKEDWGDVSISFYYNINKRDAKLQRYLSIDQMVKIKPCNTNEITISEKADKCIKTEVHYSDNVMEMIKPIIDYANENGYTLEGEFYGRENSNYYLNGKRTGLYVVYASIK